MTSQQREAAAGPPGTHRAGDISVCERTSVTVYLLHGVAVNHVRHERDIPVQEGGRSQVQWNLVCHHHCDVHSWRNSLNCPTWESTEKEEQLAHQEVFRKPCSHRRGQKQLRREKRNIDSVVWPWPFPGHWFSMSGARRVILCQKRRKKDKRAAIQSASSSVSPVKHRRDYP